jgi:hypothetical protein
MVQSAWERKSDLGERQRLTRKSDYDELGFRDEWEKSIWEKAIDREKSRFGS